MTRTCDLRFRNVQGRVAAGAVEYDSIGISAVTYGRLSYLVTGCIRQFGSKVGSKHKEHARHDRRGSPASAPIGAIMGHARPPH
jgi:hypothetical protein